MARRQPFDNWIKRLHRPKHEDAEAPAERSASKEAVRIYQPGNAAESASPPLPPTPDEVFYHNEPLPFASYVQEILEEYRSDSSPTRYAMAVELEEGEESPAGPPAEERDDPFAPQEKPSVQNILHALLSDAEDAELSPESADESPDGGASGQPAWDWLDILREYRAERAAPAGHGVRTAPSGNERSPMTTQDDLPVDKPVTGQPHSAELSAGSLTEETIVFPAETSVPAEEEGDALPAGIQRLTERRAAPEDTPHVGHLSVEDILAEFHGYIPAEPEAEASRERPAELSGRRKGRLAELESEARSLFSPFGSSRGERASAPAAKPAVDAGPQEASDASAAPLETPAPAAASALSEQDFALPFLDGDSASPAGDTAAAEGSANSAAVAEDAPIEPEAPPAEDSAGKPGADAGADPPQDEGPSAGAVKPERAAAALRAKLPRFGRKNNGRRAKGATEDGVEDKPQETASALRDEDASPAEYALEDDYEAEETPTDAFPSFGQYLAGLVTGLWIRMRGVSPAASSETMDMDEEELGEELKPAAASRYYGSFVHSLRLRFRIALILWLVLLYISLGFPVSGMLRAVDVAAGMCLGLQLGIMLLCLDVVTGCAVNLARGRFGADSLAVLCCILTSFDALAVLLKGFGSLHVPLCLISSLSLIGVLYSSYLSARGLRKSLRVPAIGKRAYSVTAEDDLTDRTITLIKSDRPVSGFVRRSEEAAPDETAYNRAAPLLLVLSVLMSLVIVVVKRSPSDFLFVLTAVLAPAVPVTALMSYAMPFFIGSQRIFTSGAAIAGWSGLCDVGNSHNLIVTDRDLFPENCVDIETIRIFADIPSEKIIAYAGTMITASGSGLGPCFAELMERNACTMRQVENFEFLPGGGLKGTIDGQTILCGGTELMRLMNVRIPYRLVEKTSVLLAIDGVLYGIFNIKYEPSPTVKKALVGLIRSNRHPIFAIRDFNINPEMLHETFDVATDGYDFPPYVERFAISDAKPSENRKIAAVLCREGLGPLVHMADTGRNMYLAIRLNLMISLLASAIGVFAVFFLLITKGTVSLGALLFYALFWIIPVTLISLILRF